MLEYTTPERPIQLYFDFEENQNKTHKYYHNVNAPKKLRKKLFNIPLPISNDNYTTPPPMTINYDIPPPIINNNNNAINDTINNAIDDTINDTINDAIDDTINDAIDDTINDEISLPISSICRVLFK
jgi:hypothetical protein